MNSKNQIIPTQIINKISQINNKILNISKINKIIKISIKQLISKIQFKFKTDKEIVCTTEINKLISK